MKYARAFPILPAMLVSSLALMVRLLYNITVAQDYSPEHDSLTYQHIADNLLHEHCYCQFSHLSTVERAPFWPMIIALITSITGSNDLFVRFFLCIVGSGTCLLLYYLSRDMFGKPIGMLAGLVAAIYPFLYIYDGWLYSESLYIFLLFAFCYTLYRLQRGPHIWLMLLSGGLLGAISLTRPNGLLLLGLFILWAIIMGKTKILVWRSVRQCITLVSLLTLLIVAPWTARNYMVTHQFIPVAVGDGKVLVGAYNDLILQLPYYLGVWLKPEISAPTISQQFPTNCAASCEVKRDATFKYYATQWLQHHQNKIPRLLRLHFFNTWQATTQEADLPINRFGERRSSRFVVKMMKYMTPIILEIAVFGLLLTWKRWREWLFIYFVILLTVLQNLVFYGIPRFRAPLEPMLILLATGAIWWGATMLRKCRRVEQNQIQTVEVSLVSSIKK